MTAPDTPGWYPDPWGTPKQRWFDGVAWTPSVWPPDDPVERASASAPPASVEAEGRSARLTAAVLPIAGVAYIATTISSVTVFRWMADNWDEFVAAAEAGSTIDPVVPSWVPALSWIGQFPLLTVQVLFLLWCYRAAVAGRELGNPARRSPGWAVGGWLIPVLNLWWPYQSVVDTVPAGDPALSSIRRWWALWLTTIAASFLVFASAFFSLTITVAAVVVQSAVAIIAALAARVMILSVLRAHAPAG